MSDPKNRILWNRRPAAGDEAGDIDEVVIVEPEMVHIEQLDEGCWWIAIYLGDGGRFWMGNFAADAAGRMTFGQQENVGVGWDRDDTHEEA